LIIKISLIKLHHKKGKKKVDMPFDSVHTGFVLVISSLCEMKVL